MRRGPRDEHVAPSLAPKYITVESNDGRPSFERFNFSPRRWFTSRGPELPPKCHHNGRNWGERWDSYFFDERCTFEPVIAKIKIRLHFLGVQVRIKSMFKIIN